MTRTARVAAALVIVATAACGGGDGGTSSAGGCAAPLIVVEPTTARAGDEVTVTGEGMFKGCADHISVNVDTGETHSEEVRPLRAVELRLVPVDGEPEILTTVTADAKGEFTVTVTVPDTVPEGTATVEISGAHAEPGELRIVP